MASLSLDRLTLKQKLAAAALVLGALAVAGDPYGGGKAELDHRELARVVEGELDHVTVQELAAWIMAGRSDYRLLDVRDEGAYAAYHIPTAEHVEVTELADYPLWRNERIVLYSDGGIHAAQAWFLLRARGYAGSLLLLGGLNTWKDEVLFPVLPAVEEGTPADAARAVTAERLRAVSRFFGGEPRGAGAAGGDESFAMPEVEMPAAPAAPPPSRRSKKKEGC